MSALTFACYFFLGICPGVAFFICFIAQKSFLVLLSFFSCFLWLTVLLITSAIFKGFLPVPSTLSSYAGLLVASVFIEEVVRIGVWWLNRKSTAMLETVALKTGHRFGIVDKLYIALAWGFGHSACHSIFFYLSFLTLTIGSGTFYLDVCPQMSLFLVGAIYSLAFGLILCSITVVAFDGYLTRNWAHVAYAPVVHFGASLATLGCMQQGGCVIAMPTVFGVGVLSAVYAGQLAWRKGLEEADDAPVLVPLQRPAGGQEAQEMQQQGGRPAAASQASGSTISRRAPALVTGGS